MKIIVASFIVSSLLAGTALAQTSVSEQSSASASDSTSISAGKTGVQANSGTSVHSTEAVGLNHNNGHATVAGQTQAGAGSQVAVDKSATSGQIKSAGSSLGSTSNIEGRTAASAGRGSAFAGSTSSSSTGAAYSAANARARASSGIADSAHFKPMGGEAALNSGASATFGMRHSNMSTSAAGAGSISTPGNSGHLTAGSQSVIRKK